ncbi:MAG TPA: Ig-like domain-containing protein [Candidatus Limnocylindrales bacterium]
MRKLGITLLALPVVALVYVALAVKSAGRFRALGFVGAAGLVAVALMAGSRPAPSIATPPSVTVPRPVAAQMLDAVVTGHGLKTPFSIGFDAPMDGPSVAGALRISPEAAVTFSWDRAGKTLSIAPVTAWAPDTLYSITVDSSARAADGGPLTTPIHVAILTAKGGSATLSATKTVGTRVAVDTTFAIHLDRPVAADAVQAAVQTDPVIAGTVTASGATGDYVFTPDAPLAPNTSYSLALVGLVDADGIAFAAGPSLAVRTVVAPGVVRFRPVNGATSVAQAAVLSVRFSDKMNRRTTAAAFTAIAGGKAVVGKVTWAESDHVLVFTPTTALPYGAKVVMTVTAGATSAAGVHVASSASVSFTVVAKPAAATKTAAKTTGGTATTPIQHPSGSGGAGAASGSWHSVEVYYLSLMNCTRTGGWVTSAGACSSPGGRNVAPLTLSAGISNNVSRPYAKLLAVRNLCNHWYDGAPSDRLRRAGYTSYNWAENIGCENLSPYQAALGDHLFFQSEKPYNGGHYVNLMNALYTEAGIGMWVDHGRVRLVIDFYRP